jgi:hypothetical protein
MSNRESMLSSIIWALNTNIHGLLANKRSAITPGQEHLSDLRLSAYTEIRVLTDDDEEMERMFKFYESLRKMKGWKHTAKKFPALLKEYPAVTRFLTITIYS